MNKQKFRSEPRICRKSDTILKGIREKVCRYLEKICGGADYGQLASDQFFLFGKTGG